MMPQSREPQEEADALSLLFGFSNSLKSWGHWKIRRFHVHSLLRGLTGVFYMCFTLKAVVASPVFAKSEDNKMLEEKLEAVRVELVALRKATEENTAALLGGKVKTTTTAGADKGKDTGKAKSKFSATEVESMAKRVAKEVSTPMAKELIKATGADDLADLIKTKQAKWDDFMEACDSKLTPDDEPADKDEDEL